MPPTPMMGMRPFNALPSLAISAVDFARSGAPVRDKSTAVIRALAAELQGALPIIGAGGILSGADAAEKINAGAALVQVYSGLIYRGPALVGECCAAIRALD